MCIHMTIIQAKNFLFAHERNFVQQSTGKAEQQNFQSSANISSNTALLPFERSAEGPNICQVDFPADCCTKVHSFVRNKELVGFSHPHTANNSLLGQLFLMSLDGFITFYDAFTLHSTR